MKRILWLDTSPNWLWLDSFDTLAYKRENCWWSLYPVRLIKGACQNLSNKSSEVEIILALMSIFCHRWSWTGTYYNKTMNVQPPQNWCNTTQCHEISSNIKIAFLSINTVYSAVIVGCLLTSWEFVERDKYTPWKYYPMPRAFISTLDTYNLNTLTKGGEGWVTPQIFYFSTPHGWVGLYLYIAILCFVVMKGTRSGGEGVERWRWGSSFTYSSWRLYLHSLDYPAWRRGILYLTLVARQQFNGQNSILSYRATDFWK